MDFNWVPPGVVLAPGDHTLTLLIETNGPTFTDANLTIADGVSGTVGGYGPAGPVTPEPSSMALFAMAGLGALGYGWRRRGVKCQA